MLVSTVDFRMIWMSFIRLTIKRHLKAVNWQLAKFSESKEEKAMGTCLVSSARHTSFSVSC